MPPELEKGEVLANMDFRPSDVYLFAKVLWMALKGDNIGFYGQYNRGEKMIYIDKKQYSEVPTFEPIHRLLTEATFKEMGDRISIQKCIQYLKCQKKILEDRDDLPDLIAELRFEEIFRYNTSANKPNKIVYDDASVINKMLRDIVLESDICLEVIFDPFESDKTRVTDFEVDNDGNCRFISLIGGIVTKEYIMRIKSVTCSCDDSKISLELLEPLGFNLEHDLTKSCSDDIFGSNSNIVILSSKEKVHIIKGNEYLKDNQSSLGAKIRDW